MIKIKQLNKKYPNKEIYCNFNLDIKENEFCAVVGESGSGKSTLLNMIGLIDQNYDGEIIVDGVNYNDLNKPRKRQAFIRENISFLFQNYALINDETVYHNLLLALYYTKLNKKEKNIQIKEALTKVGLSEKINSKVCELSGGEQQRVALARTLLKPSKVVLADEPTGNLDNINKNEVFDLLKTIQKANKTILMVTHDLELAQRCDRIIEIKHL